MPGVEAEVVVSSADDFGCQGPDEHLERSQNDSFEDVAGEGVKRAVADSDMHMDENFIGVFDAGDIAVEHADFEPLAERLGDIAFGEQVIDPEGGAFESAHTLQKAAFNIVLSDKIGEGFDDFLTAVEANQKSFLNLFKIHDQVTSSIQSR